MKRIKIEIDIPDYEWIDVPVSYQTHIGIVETLQQAIAASDLMIHIRQIACIEEIINANIRDVLYPFAYGVIKRRLKFVNDSNIEEYTSSLVDFLYSFRKSTGLIFSDYTFEYRALSTGKKIQFNTFTMLFDNEQEAFRHIARIYTHRPDFEFEEI